MTSTTTTTPAVSALTDPAADAAIGAACATLHLPTVRTEAARIAEAAARERLTHRAFLAEVLTAGVVVVVEVMRSPPGRRAPG
jgi:hypothetical protein